MTDVQAPEVAEAMRQLETVPEEFRFEALGETVLRRAYLLSTARRLEDRLRQAKDHAAQAVATVTTGAFEALDDLIFSQGQVAALERARAELPEPTLDAAAVGEALDAAHEAVRVSDRRLGVPTLDADTEVAYWLRACRAVSDVYAPPILTDTERGLSSQLEVLRAEVERCWAGSRAWASDARTPGRGEPLSMLAAAGGHIAGATNLAAQLAEVRPAVEQANAARKASGLTWRHPLADIGVGVL